MNLRYPRKKNILAKRAKGWTGQKVEGKEGARERGFE